MLNIFKQVHELLRSGIVSAKHNKQIKRDALHALLIKGVMCLEASDKYNYLGIWKSKLDESQQP